MAAASHQKRCASKDHIAWFAAREHCTPSGVRGDLTRFGQLGPAAAARPRHCISAVAYTWACNDGMPCALHAGADKWVFPRPIYDEEAYRKECGGEDVRGGAEANEDI